MSQVIKVGIDARMIAHSGIGTYLRNLLREIPRQNPAGMQFVLFGNPAFFKDMNGSYALQDFRQPVYSLSEQAGYRSRLRSVDLWHAPHFNAPLASPARLVVTVHDLIPLIFSGRFFSKLHEIYITAMLKNILKTARRVIAVSHNTKGDLVHFFRVPENRIRVIHEGVSEHFRPVTDPGILEKVRSRYSLPQGQSFLLYVGVLKPHKNLRLLVATIKRLRREQRLRETLVIVGAKDARYAPEGRYLAEIGSDEDLHYVERVEREDLPALYSSAKIFVMPSLYEGFGLPVLEAMACGTPVIAARRASLPEVAGEAALFFEPESGESLAEAVLKLTRDEALSKEMKARGELRARQFSWAKMTRETLDTYREALAIR